MKTTKHLIYLLSIALVSIIAAPAAAQTGTSDTEAPLILPISPSRTVTFRSTLGMYKVVASVDYTVTSDAAWCSVTKTDGGFNYRIEQNAEKTSRDARITLKNEENGISRVVTLTQEASQLEKYVTTPDLTVKATGGTDGDGNTLAKTLDGYMSTYYSYNTDKGKITQDTPLNLDYTFNGAHVDYIKYIPSEYATGIIAKAEVSYKKVGSDEFVSLGIYDFSPDGSTVLVALRNGGADSVAVLRIAVWDGTVIDNQEYFGCAEMQFQKSINNTDDYSVFADELLSTLRPGVTQEDIDNISNPYVQDLARQIYNGTYSTAYRVAKYKCLPPPKAVADTLLTSKWYDRFEGVTGIMVSPGQFSVVVSGVPQGVSPQLYITAYRPKSGNTGPSYKTYTIKNGMNVLNYTADSVGLAYVVYTSNTPEAYDSLGVHFVNGVQNGYVTNKMTNDSIATILKNAKYMCMDMLNDRCHLVFEAKSLLKYTAGRYRQLMNIYDTIMTWEHRLLGLEKYNRIPKNRTLFYVNYDYFMYQTYLGASAKYDVTDILKPMTILNKNSATVWGIAHEWGHQQQSTYFTWGGFAEISNNYFSAYVYMHMGEKTESFFSKLSNGYRDYFVNDYFATKDSISPARTKAYAFANNYSYSTKLKEAALAMKDAKIPSRAEDEAHSANFAEYTDDPFENRLAATENLFYYFEKEKGYLIQPDFFQEIRKTNTGTNKYELIASAQNKVSGRMAQLRELYPESVWVTENYVHENTKANWNDANYILNFIYKMSTVTGLNLTPYYEKWGFLRLIATYMSDYGDHYYNLTEEMLNEFKTDMNARVASGELEEMSDELITKIANYPMPMPNIYPVLSVPN